MSMMSPPVRIRLGTRGSALALAQAAIVGDLLQARHSGLAVEPVVIRTEGDLDKTSPLTLIGGRGVFTSALQDALLRGEIDAAVHSAKDLPSDQPPGLLIAAVPVRDDPRDVLVSRHRLPLVELPADPTVGTSSRRRAVQVRARRPDARIVDLRGNVDTRLRKAEGPDLDAIVLAAAGVRRMGGHDRITEHLSLDCAVPSPGQGALAVEARADDPRTRDLLALIDCPNLHRALRVERAFLRAVGGGCTTPLGAHAHPAPDGRFRFLAMLASEDGGRVEWADELLDPATAEPDAAHLAVRLLALVRASGGLTFGYHTSLALEAPSDDPPATARASQSHSEFVSANGSRTRSSNGARTRAASSAHPLAGLTVLVTRARDQAAPLSAALQAAGATPLEFPTIRIAPPSDPAPLAAAVRAAAGGAYDWIAFTSANAVDRFLAAATDLEAAPLSFASTSIAAVGAATAARLRAVGLPPALVPDRAVAEALVAALAGRGIIGQRVLYPHADQARDALPAGLRAAGALVDAVATYRTLPETDADPDVLARLRRGEVDVVTFASGTSVRNLAALLAPDLSPLHHATIACVGPVTAAAARDLGLAVDVIATDASVDGIVAALVEHHRQPERIAVR